MKKLFVMGLVFGCLLLGSKVPAFTAEPTFAVVVTVKAPAPTGLNLGNAPSVVVSEYGSQYGLPKAEINDMQWNGSAYVGQATLVMSSYKSSYKIKAEASMNYRDSTWSFYPLKGISYVDVSNPVAGLGTARLTVNLVVPQPSPTPTPNPN